MATLMPGKLPPEGAPTTPSRRFLTRLRASRPVQAALATGVVVLALVGIGAMLLVAEARQREVKAAKVALLNLNGLSAQSIGRALESIDLVLQTVEGDIRQEGGASPEALDRYRRDRTLHDMLRLRVVGLPQLAALSVIDRDGRLVAHSRGFPTPEIDLSDRDHFRRMTRERAPEPFLSEPLQNRATGDWSIYLARRLLSPSGELAGVVYAAIDLSYFARSYSALVLRRGTSMSLWRLDGTLVARYPTTERIGQRTDAPALRDLIGARPPSVEEGPSPIDGSPSLVAWNLVPGFPMATAIERTAQSVLAEWRDQAIAFGVVTGLLAAAVAAVTAASMRQFWAYEDVARAERERAAAMRSLDELEEQLRQSQKLEAIGQLTSGVAHDFNNLLTVVIGNLDRMTRRLGDEDTPLQRYVANARAGAERAAQLCARLLAFARRQPPDPQRLDVSEIVSGLSDLLHQSIGKKAALEFDLASGLPPILADRAGLETALINLVVNARDAMPEGGTVTIETKATPPQTGAPGDVCLTVADTGSGMTPAVVRRAFEPFFTTKAAGVGTGLGLAQVAGFARQNGGTVAIDSREGEGTRVAFCFPPAGMSPAQTIDKVHA
ncbi:hybrid sensor histidine kinase/response regulator [Enterovirga rhinocerotis]|uniref:histidine kinase n=1 Tax=Enterovirga rhinocerotis TaxID=1339210 RepID=A0A4R7C5P1_9HYPH|nr:hybrid sensor histidine kinase/response regulator [Enterovirga rhinocerotis]TDR93212.1 signal transduction histidine kinase [Enterovirga rhinocerotis]